MSRITYRQLTCWLLVCFVIIPVSAAAQAQQSALVIEGGTLIDGNGGAPVRDALIIIRANRIETVSRKGQASAPAGAQVIRADGKFILPGFMDAHTHYAAFLAELLLAHGVTSVFDIGGRGEYQVFRREAAARGMVAGPRQFIGFESLLDAPKPGRVVYGSQGRQSPVTVEKAREIVRRALAGGADEIDIRRGLSEEIFRAGVEEAHKGGKPVVAQPIGPMVWAKEAALAGADVLEHAAGVSISIAKDPSKWKGWEEIEVHSLDPTPYSDMDEAKAAELIRLLVDRKVYLEPDLIAQGRGLHSQRKEWEGQDHVLLEDPELAYIPLGTRRKFLANYTENDDLKPAEWEQRVRGFKNNMRFIGQFARAGGKVMTGTDTSAGGWATAGIGLHREMELLVESGMTAMQAIQAATRNPAEGYRVLDRVGTIEPGKFADLVIVNADPLQDIRNTRKIEWVIKDGKVIDRTYHRWFVDPFPGDWVEAPEWVESLKQITSQGRTLAGLMDPTWAFGQPCPGIEAISPIQILEGSSGLTLTIKGVNFTPKSTVYLGERPIPSKMVSDAELQATIGAGSLQRPGIFSIQVRNPGPPFSHPQWGSSSNKAFLLVNFRE